MFVAIEFVLFILAYVYYTLFYHIHMYIRNGTSDYKKCSQKNEYHRKPDKVILFAMHKAIHSTRTPNIRCYNIAFK